MRLTKTTQQKTMRDDRLQEDNNKRKKERKGGTRFPLFTKDSLLLANARVNNSLLFLFFSSSVFLFHWLFHIRIFLRRSCWLGGGEEFKNCFPNARQGKNKGVGCCGNVNILPTNTFKEKGKEEEEINGTESDEVNRIGFNKPPSLFLFVAFFLSFSLKRIEGNVWTFVVLSVSKIYSNRELDLIVTSAGHAVSFVDGPGVGSSWERCEEEEEDEPPGRNNGPG